MQIVNDTKKCVCVCACVRTCVRVCVRKLADKREREGRGGFHGISLIGS